VQLANHFSTTHDDVRLLDLFSADEVRQINNAKSIRLAEQSYGISNQPTSNSVDAAGAGVLCQVQVGPKMALSAVDL
jgi:hypothetical protein